MERGVDVAKEFGAKIPDGIAVVVGRVRNGLLMSNPAGLIVIDNEFLDVVRRAAAMGIPWVNKGMQYMLTHELGHIVSESSKPTSVLYAEKYPGAARNASEASQHLLACRRAEIFAVTKSEDPIEAVSSALALDFAFRLSGMSERQAAFSYLAMDPVGAIGLLMPIGMHEAKLNFMSNEAMDRIKKATAIKLSELKAVLRE